MHAPGCRFCGAPLTRDFVDLGSTPLANSYLTADQIARGLDKSWPLRTRVCATWRDSRATLGDTEQLRTLAK